LRTQIAVITRVGIHLATGSTLTKGVAVRKVSANSASADIDRLSFLGVSWRGVANRDL
jgi:hypothetical protein